MLHSRVKRSSSLTPPGNVIAQGNCSPSSLSSIHLVDQENSPFGLSNNSLRPADHAPLSPQSSVTSSGSGSDGQKDDKDVFSQDGTGMKGLYFLEEALKLASYGTATRIVCSKLYVDFFSLLLCEPVSPIGFESVFASVDEAGSLHPVV